jgi:hypothetical protein
VDYSLTNNDGLTALDIAEGKQPPNAAGAGRRGAAPPGGGRGRGRGASRAEVAALLRELMGLPPAATAATPSSAPDAPAADPVEDAAEAGAAQ